MVPSSVFRVIVEALELGKKTNLDPHFNAVKHVNTRVGINIHQGQTSLRSELRAPTCPGDSLDIQESESVQRWLLNLEANSAKLYTRAFREFCQLVNLTPDGLLAKAETEQGKQHVHDAAKRFYQHLDNQGLASWTCTVYYAAVRSFFNWNDRPLGRMPEKFAGHTQYESDRILTPQEVAKLIDMAVSVRDKAIISFLHQTAQRAGILTALKYGDVRSQLEAGVHPVVIDIKAIALNAKGANVNKKRTRYRCAIGKETADYLRRMIEQRRQAGEQLTDDSWLFIGQRNDPIDLKVVMNTVTKAAGKAGIQVTRTIGKTRDGKVKRKNEIHSHVFRRTWKGAMREASVTDANLLNFMIGHKLPYGGAYDKYTAEYIRKEYAKAEPRLTVMVSQEIAMKQERDTLETEYVQTTKRRPEQDFPEYTTWTLERQVRFLKPVVGKASMARMATAEQVKEVLRIDESQAENHLNHGYELVTVLPSGKLLIRKKKD